MTILQTAQNWANQDPDNETKAELQALIDNNDIAELEQRFSGRLQFGTAGLRGKIQAGSMGMNRVLVSQTASGLARFLIARNGGSAEGLSIVIGYDGRKNSDVFAKDTAEIMQGFGINAFIMPDLRPTPVLSYAVRHLKASAGVMVTASHNPPEDNGYKVYLGGEDDGAQIISPNDNLIAEQIDWVATNQLVSELPRNTNYSTVNDEVIDAYLDRTTKVKQAPTTELKYVYTAMHGIGTKTLLEALQRADLPAPILVAEQCQPDGTFPTVAFPNPEEKGALDLAIAKAKADSADFIVANDPDADRLAVAVADEDGNWATLHGNEIGLLLAWHLGKKAVSNDPRLQDKGVLACSLVSSPALAQVAKDCGLNHQETLTGFKYIGRIPDLVFGYEEALGYLVNPDTARDKDGISAIVAFLDLINHLKTEGKTFADYRQAFTNTFGAFVSDQISIRVEDLDRIGRVLSSVRAKPFSQIAGLEVSEYVDHLNTDYQNNILVFYLKTEGIEDAEATHRVILRPSGTEPKLKIYLDTTGTNVAEAKAISERLKTELNAFLAGIE